VLTSALPKLLLLPRGFQELKAFQEQGILAVNAGFN
jgi:hypothetical protein